MDDLPRGPSGKRISGEGVSLFRGVRHVIWSGISDRVGLRLIPEWTRVFSASEKLIRRRLAGRDEFPERVSHALRLLWVLLALTGNVGSR